MGVNVKNITGVVIGLVILMSLAAALYPTFSTAGSDLNASGVGLGSLFVGTLLGLIFGAAILYAVLKGFGVM